MTTYRIDTTLQLQGMTHAPGAEVVLEPPEDLRDRLIATGVIRPLDTTPEPATDQHLRSENQHV